MRLDDIDYSLPPHLVAQYPAAQRDASRLLVVRQPGATLSHRYFRDLPSLLEPGDLLVLNDTRVLPARVVGRRCTTDGKWEGLYLTTRSDGLWEMLCQTGGKPSLGERFETNEVSPLTLELMERTAEGRWLMRPQVAGNAIDLLSRHGQIPLPPYIRKGVAEPTDAERYQTVYARDAGAVAAPTAGLHFTSALFETLERRGIERAFVTLHVGVGTFQPVQTERIDEHRVAAEWGELSEATAVRLAACRARGGRIVAVGTTSVRVLESAVRQVGFGQSWSGWTDLTICPPFTFQAIDALITNFHLPKSSLLLLVAAFIGLDTLRNIYQTAIDEQYRFYSYGDAMLILGSRR